VEREATGYLQVSTKPRNGGLVLEVDVAFEILAAAGIGAKALEEEILPDIQHNSGLKGVSDFLIRIDDFFKKNCSAVANKDGSVHMLMGPVDPKLDADRYARIMAANHRFGDKDLPPCRNCGAPATETPGGVVCSSVDCILTLIPMPVETWFRNSVV
jgi:hypothetical protein